MNRIEIDKKWFEDKMSWRISREGWGQFVFSRLSARLGSGNLITTIPGLTFAHVRQVRFTILAYAREEWAPSYD